MDQVQQLIAKFRTRARASARSKLDALMDLERLSDPRVLPFLLELVAEPQELPEVRSHLIKRLRSRDLASHDRAAVAQVLSQLLRHSPSTDLRLQSAVALGEFADVDGVPAILGVIALDRVEPLDLRYSAFTSLERAGPTMEASDILRQLASDETLGGSARRLLSTWNPPTPHPGT
jgi:HEAT repeat protein